MFALVRQLQSLIGADGDLEVDDCDGSYNKEGDYNGYDGGFVVNVCGPSSLPACYCASCSSIRAPHDIALPYCTVLTDFFCSTTFSTSQ